MYWITTQIEIVLVALPVLIAAIVILQQRRTPQSAAVWLLSIIVVPWLAIPLFLALGFRKKSGRFTPVLFSGPLVEPVRSASDLDAVLCRYGLPPASQGNALHLIASPQTAYSELMGLVEGATASLDVLFYIIADDPVGEAFVAALEAKARAGIRVRLLIDRFGTWHRPRKALARLEAAGAEVRYFSPFLQRSPVGHLNLRNHRKMVIADRARLFAGGMNVAKEYMGSAIDQTHWTDLAFLLEGPGVVTYRDVFRSDWAVTGVHESTPDTRPPVPSAGKAIVQPVVSGPDIFADPLHDALIHAIHVATTRVWIATPYFLPTELLSHALSLAARRGVDVRIMLPERSNQRLADFARGAYLREMQEAGAKVLFHQGAMMHAKAGLIDDAAYVGSANFDVRSMLLNFELVLFVYDTLSVIRLADWFERHQGDCIAGVRHAGLQRRVLEGVFRLGAPIL